jgi:hypothetical protein
MFRDGNEYHFIFYTYIFTDIHWYIPTYVLTCTCGLVSKHSFVYTAANGSHPRGLLRAGNLCLRQGCQMVFSNQNPNLGKFWSAFDW